MKRDDSYPKVSLSCQGLLLLGSEENRMRGAKQEPELSDGHGEAFLGLPPRMESELPVLL